jgi:hypothetical protein
LLKPLGNPPANGIKFFATGDLLESIKDRNWLVRLTSAINHHWHRQNTRKRMCMANSVPNGQVSSPESLVSAAG